MCSNCMLLARSPLDEANTATCGCIKTTLRPEKLLCYRYQQTSMFHCGPVALHQFAAGCIAASATAAAVAVAVSSSTTVVRISAFSNQTLLGVLQLTA